MNKKYQFSLHFISLLLISFTCISQAHQENTKASVIAEGGRLYDKWWQEYGLAQPATTHPAYPKSAKQKGATTWRCKECHGWDYRGQEGAYSKGSHYTGIKGIQNYDGKPVNNILKILKDNNHQYDKVMLDSALKKLALFVSQGQVNPSNFIDRKSKKAKGDVPLGQHVYADKCLRCHGINGKDINFKDDSNPEYVGTVASKNPWEALHKIYNGHPGSLMMHRVMHGGHSLRQRRHIGLISSMESMPFMRNEISAAGIMHLLTYIQTLPSE
ncbi:MAG: hypothetical protein OEY78_07150 [Gammaproteobacteria bacterium]|nr:hypothetical protein [Gammaproteobacteria bacterium]